MPTQIKAFEDQETARVAISDGAAAEAAELILMMDLVTSGGDGLGALKDAAGNPHAAYFEFRDFFAPHIASSIRAFAGRVLQAAEVHEDGLVSLHLGRKRPAPSAVMAFAGRLEWLVAEIESLQDAYGQLYPADVEEFEALRGVLDSVDLLRPEQLAQAREVWPQLETIYRHAQCGARIYRGDEDAIQLARDTIDAMGSRIKVQEAAAAKRKAQAIGDEEPQTQEEIDAALDELEFMKTAAIERRDRLQRAVADADVEIRQLAERLTNLAMITASDPWQGQNAKGHA